MNGATGAESSDTSMRPVVASYCATFLKPEMLHIYRQLTGLRRVRPMVVAQKRENAERFPFSPLEVVGKPGGHFLRRFWFRQVRDAPWQISRGELRRLIEILNRHDAALLHIYFGHIAVHLLPLIRAWPRPVVVSFHGADVGVDLEKPAYRAATHEMLKEVRLVLVRSYSLGKAIAELGCEPEKIRLQRTGIPVAEIPFHERVWPQNGAWRLVQACRLIEKKGLRTSLRAFANFVGRFPQATFTIAGEGPLLEKLQTEARALGVAGKVSFPGFLSQSSLRDLFYRSHIFLHPSETSADGNQEGVPNSMLEAMASGLPVLATEHGGIPEAIESGKNGLLVPEGDHATFGAKLFELTGEPQRLTDLARRAAETIAREFDLVAQVTKLEDHYFEAMGSSD